MKPEFVISCPIDTYSGYGARSRDLVKAIIELDKYDIGQMQKNRYGHDDVLTRGYMLDILHDIVDQIHDQL